jgi:hypothetical protein
MAKISPKQQARFEKPFRRLGEVLKEAEPRIRQLAEELEKLKPLHIALSKRRGKF